VYSYYHIKLRTAPKDFMLNCWFSIYIYISGTTIRILVLCTSPLSYWRIT